MQRDYVIALVSSLLALGGVVTGGWMSGYYSQKQFQMQARLAQHERLMTKRIEVIEHCVSARADISRAKMIMDLVQLDELAIQSAASSKSTSETREHSAVQWKTTYDSYEHQREFAQIRTNWAKCVQMGAVMFGPRTKAAALSLNSVPKWYEDVNRKEYIEFTDALLSEVNHGREDP